MWYGSLIIELNGAYIGAVMYLLPSYEYCIQSMLHHGVCVRVPFASYNIYIYILIYVYKYIYMSWAELLNILPVVDDILEN